MSRIFGGNERMNLRPRGWRPYHAATGVLAIAAGLGASELAAALVPGARSLVIGVGDAVIDLVPAPVERAAIDLLGTADKPFLLANILVISAVVGAVLGIVAARRPAVALAGIALLTVLGIAGELTDPRSEAGGVVVVGLVYGIAAAAALLGLRAILVRGARTSAESVTLSRADGPVARPAPEPGDPTTVAVGNRRSFLKAAVVLSFSAGLAGLSGQFLAGRQRVEQLRSLVRLPKAARAAAAVPAGASLPVDGVSRLFTPNKAFYRIDTALSVPNVDPQDWQLSVKGMVKRPFSLSYDELMDMPQVQADVTLACVSNVVGGELVGNARWQGVLLRDLLDRAGVRGGSTQLIGRSVDGFTAGFPVSVAMNRENAMVAVGMNGEPLPLAHGFPARLVIPGLYGYVSATKWLSSIELTTWEAASGYWIPRGWSREAPIKTQSRIDVPKRGVKVAAGTRPIAGVAWAPTRGIEQVEVRVDDGPWEQAELADAINDECWRQWKHGWNATPGNHTITVRATDGDGRTQTAKRQDVLPNGATGHHTVLVEVQAA